MKCQNKGELFVRNAKGNINPVCKYHWDDANKLKVPNARELLDQLKAVSFQDGEQEYLNQMKQLAFQRLQYNNALSKEEACLKVAEALEKEFGFPKDLTLEILNSDE